MLTDRDCRRLLDWKQVERFAGASFGRAICAETP
jgi:hypothetical protein